jgi:ribosomal protein S18 acetylase RimI-like enzyme
MRAAPEIRGFASGDLEALYAISLATGHAGRDAAHFYADPKMMGHIYAAPYAVLSPNAVLVAEDGDGVVGYAAGSLDTRAWEEQLARDWWPSLSAQYPDPGEDATQAMTHDQRRAAMIHRPTRTPLSVATRFPAHLHLNLLPAAQGRGLGSRLFEAWRTAQNAGPMHVAVNRNNEDALGFWTKLGFSVLAGSDIPNGRTVWLGRDSLMRGE